MSLPTCEAIGHRLPPKTRSSALLAGPSVQCAERYFEQQRCGGIELLFSRLERQPAGSCTLGSTHCRLRALCGVRQIGEKFTCTIARARHTTSGGGAYGPPFVALPFDLNLSTNAGFLCSRPRDSASTSEVLVAFGGTAHDFVEGQMRGGASRSASRVTLGRDGQLIEGWASPKLAVDVATSATQDCLTDPRVRAHPTHGGACSLRFDGKLSLVRFRGNLLLFARANLARRGGRHVQVATSRDDGRSWGNFTLLRFAGHSPHAESNIYFFSAVEHRGRLVAVFPAHPHRRFLPATTVARCPESRRAATSGTIAAAATYTQAARQTATAAATATATPALRSPSRRSSGSALKPSGSSTRTPLSAHEWACEGGGVYLSTSDDGVSWTAPQRLIWSEAADNEGRTTDHPVDHGIEVGADGRVSVAMQHELQLMHDGYVDLCGQAGHPPRPFLCRHTFDADGSARLLAGLPLVS